MTGLIDEALVARVAQGELRRHRQSLLNDADICLRRAAYGLTRGRQGGSEATVCGTAYHAAQEVYWRWRQAEEKITEIRPDKTWPAWPAPTQHIIEAAYAAAEMSVHESVRDFPDFPWDTSYAETVDRAQKMIYAYFAGGHYWPAEYRVLGVEVDFTLQSVYPGWVDSGTIDLVLFHTSTGHTILDDHKTAGKPWQKNKESPRKTNQPAFYDGAWERATGVKPDAFAFSVMTYACAFDRRMVYVTDQDRRLTETKARVVLPLLKAAVEDGLELPGNTSSFLCDRRWCDHYEVCSYGDGTD